jgi:hypothetical protein
MLTGDAHAIGVTAHRSLNSGDGIIDRNHDAGRTEIAVSCETFSTIGIMQLNSSIRIELDTVERPQQNT